MKSITLICLASLILLGGCNPGRQATFASAESFTKLLVAELQKTGKLEDLEFNIGSSHALNSHTKEFSRFLPAADFPPERLYDAANAALSKWGKGYSTRGGAGYDNHFYFDYGSNGSRAFIDVIAYREGDKTRVDFLIRVVE